MNYKGLTAAVFLCVTLANIPTPASAQQFSSHSPAQFQAQKESTVTSSSGAAAAIPAVQENHATPGMLDTIWIVSLAITGLLLLRKVQGE